MDLYVIQYIIYNIIYHDNKLLLTLRAFSPCLTWYWKIPYKFSFKALENMKNAYIVHIIIIRGGESQFNKVNNYILIFKIQYS